MLSVLSDVNSAWAEVDTSRLGQRGGVEAVYCRNAVELYRSTAAVYRCRGCRGYGALTQGVSGVEGCRARTQCEERCEDGGYEYP